MMQFMSGPATSGRVPGLHDLTPGGSFVVSNDVPSMSLDDMANSAMDIPSEYGVTFAQANTFIVQAFKCRPYNDGWQEHIMECMPVFACRHFDPKYDTTVIATVGQLNIMLRESYFTYTSWLSSNDTEATRFRTLLMQHGEKKLEYYHQLHHQGRHADLATYAGKNAGIAELYAIAQKDVFCNQTKMGILHKWNWLGVVKSRTKASSLLSIDNVSYDEDVSIIGVVMGEKVRVHNYWGSKEFTHNGAKIYFILKRVLGRDGEYKQFQITPYATNQRESVPWAMKWYKIKREIGEGEETEEVMEGHVWKLGTVTEQNESYASQGSIQQALGLNHSESASYEATPRLPQIYVQLGI